MSVKHIHLFLESLSPERRHSLVRLCVEVDLPLRKALYEPAEPPMCAGNRRRQDGSGAFADGEGPRGQGGRVQA
jgi:hypothetical protein